MRTRHPALMYGAMSIAIASVGSCESGIPTVCTMEFRAETITLLDMSGAPVPDAAVVSTLLRTGEVLSPTSLALHAEGTYIIVDDGSREKLRSTGDSVRVVAQRGSALPVTATYLIDVPGGCHIHKVSGPDTLTME